MPGEGDGAVAAGQRSRPGPAPPIAIMRVDDPPPSRPLRIKKKAKPGNVPPRERAGSSYGR